MPSPEAILHNDAVKSGEKELSHARASFAAANARYLAALNGLEIKKRSTGWYKSQTTKEEIRFMEQTVAALADERSKAEEALGHCDTKFLEQMLGVVDYQQEPGAQDELIRPIGAVSHNLWIEAIRLGSLDPNTLAGRGVEDGVFKGGIIEIPLVPQASFEQKLGVEKTESRDIFDRLAIEAYKRNTKNDPRVSYHAIGEEEVRTSIGYRAIQGVAAKNGWLVLGVDVEGKKVIVDANTSITQQHFDALPAYDRNSIMNFHAQAIKAQRDVYIKQVEAENNRAKAAARAAAQKAIDAALNTRDGKLQKAANERDEAIRKINERYEATIAPVHKDFDEIKEAKLASESENNAAADKIMADFKEGLIKALQRLGADITALKEGKMVPTIGELYGVLPAEAIVNAAHRVTAPELPVESTPQVSEEKESDEAPVAAPAPLVPAK